jgi:hypothetical protein
MAWSLNNFSHSFTFCISALLSFSHPFVKYRYLPFSRVSGSGSSIFSNCGSGSGSRDLMTKILLLKYFFLIKNYILLIPRPSERIPKLQEKPSALKREHPALQNMIFLLFIFLWVIFALLIRIPIQQHKLMRIHADPEPKPCLSLHILLIFMAGQTTENTVHCLL